ncbi:unnamed protein product [Staurois parvus]|uniref:Uncharacterized protein n=1 Tax=Staurois parvus TaxID=386267 RepID=A0ABN9D3L6_9NEOB|nr:unnamed protein product [Staurois parvus]
MSVGGIVPHHWCQWEEKCPLIGVMCEEKCSIISVSGRNRAPSLVSVGRIVPHHWCQWEEKWGIIPPTDTDDGALFLH